MRFYSIPLRRIALLSVLLLLAATSAFGREAEYDIAFETDVMVPMRDGVRLATDIYRPAKDGQPISERLPTILTRLP